MKHRVGQRVSYKNKLLNLIFPFLFLENHSKTLEQTNGCLTSSCHQDLRFYQTISISQKKRDRHAHPLLLTKTSPRITETTLATNRFDRSKHAICKSSSINAVPATIAIVKLD